MVDHRHRETETELVSICRDFLRAFSERQLDGLANRFASGAVVVRGGGAAGETRVSDVPAFLTRTEESLDKIETFKEWISAPPRVLVDGNVACVWAPYSLVANEYQATGTDVFQFVKLAGEWRIVSLTYTHRAW